MVGSTVVVMEGELSLAEHRERIAAGRSSLATLGSALWQARRVVARTGPLA